MSLPLIQAPPLSLKAQSAWLLVAKIVGFSLSFMLPLTIVRYLAQDAVGHYREAFQVIMNAVIILPLGVSMSAYYFLARETENRRGAAIFNILLFNFVVGGLACLFLFLYPQSLGNIFQSDEVTRLAPKIGVVIWIWVFSTFLETIAIANQEAKVATAFIIAAQFSKTVLMGSAVLVYGTVEALVYAAMIQGIIQTIILLNYLVRRFSGFWRQFDFSFLRQQLAYAIPFGLAGILWIAQSDIHNYFVGYKFSSADFAIYAYGCFEIPLIAMLGESVTSVLIPRMNALQLVGDREEMIRLTTRAMQKLAFFYFPIYVFFVITAGTFIVTLFTDKYEASVPVFIINLTLLPFSIFITDPIVRSYKELGRLFLLTRMLVLISLVAVLYYGLRDFAMTGMIASAVGAIVIEKFIASAMVVRKLGVGMKHLPLLKNIAKTAVISAFAGAVLYFVHANLHEYMTIVGQHFALEVCSTAKLSTINFIAGGMVLAFSAAVFAPIYLLAANFWGVIEDEDKQTVCNLLGKLMPARVSKAFAETRA
jgi:O-antigen/teichoic acid export membrane protein